MTDAQTQTLPAERRSSLNEVGISQAGAGGMMMPETMADVVRFAEVMCKADLALPKHLRGNGGACMAVTMQALRWEMDPFAVANKTYSVNDRLAYEAQLVAAVVLTRSPIVGFPSYTYSGEGVTRRCKVSIVMKSGETLEYETPQFKDIPTKNSPLWKGDPDQQLGYYAMRSWARRHQPHVLLGVYTPDEVANFGEPRNVTPEGTGLRARLEARREQPTEGFAATHGPGADAGATASAAQLVQDGEFVPHDPATGEVLEETKAAADQSDPAQDFPGDRPAFDAVAWALQFESDLPGYGGVDVLEMDWTEHKAAVEAQDPELFKRVNLAVARRAQEIAGASAGSSGGEA